MVNKITTQKLFEKVMRLLGFAFLFNLKAVCTPPLKKRKLSVIFVENIPNDAFIVGTGIINA